MTGRLRLGEEAAPGGERRGRRVRRAELVGRAERQHLPPALAGGREPVDEARTRSGRAARPAATSGAARSRSIGEAAPSLSLTVRHRRKSRNRAPAHLEAAASADPDPERPRRRSTAARYPVEGDRRRPGRGHGGHLQGRSRPAARGRAVPAGRHAQVARERRSSRVGNDHWAGELRGDRARPLAVHGRGLGRPLRELARRARPQARGRAGRPGGRALGGRGALRRRASSPSWRAAAPALGAKDGTARRRSEARSRWTSSASAPASAPGTSSSRARGAASGASPKVLPQLAELGFDVVYLPPVHPIGDDEPQGPEQHARRGGGRSRQPVGDRRPRGRPRRDPPRARHVEGLRRDGRGRPRRRASRSRSTSRSSARPTIPGSRASGVVQPAARRDAQVRREPAQAVPGHLQRQLRLGGLAAGSGRRCATSCSAGASAACAIFRVDNPHTKSVRFWEWLIREVRAEFPDTIFLSEAFTRPAMMTTLAKVGLRPVLHVLHLEEHEGGARRVRRAARSAGRRTTGRTSSPTRRTSCTSTSSAAARRRSRRGSCSRRRSRRRYGIYSGFENFENVPLREGSEEYLDSEKYELKERAARRAAAAARAAAERDPARGAGAAAVRERALPRDAQRAPARLREGA